MNIPRKKNLASHLISNVIDTAVIVSSLAIMGLMLFLILSRYVFGWSIVGVLELVMVFGIWLYMLGAITASRKRDHLVIDLLALSLRSERTRSFHKILISLITGVISLFFIYWSYKMLMWGLKRPQVTPALSIPVWIPQSAIMLAAVASFLYALRDLILDARNLTTAVARIPKESA
ncbi:MAG: TRAP transporter small permease [Marinobacter sp.]|nr:TRAP transporter small permease [Marinobacter sp.]